MAYNYSKLDEDNLKWFPNDNSCTTLRKIKILRGQIRGLKEVTIDFCYPITAIAGRNGSCKTTVLALSACAFHNAPNGFKLSGRKHPYYTFSDFLFRQKKRRHLETYESAMKSFIINGKGVSLELAGKNALRSQVAAGIIMIRGLIVLLYFLVLSALFHIQKEVYLRAIEANSSRELITVGKIAFVKLWAESLELTTSVLVSDDTQNIVYPS
jgi:hypothetical protein